MGGGLPSCRSGKGFVKCVCCELVVTYLIGLPLAGAATPAHVCAAAYPTEPGADRGLMALTGDCVCVRTE